MNRITIEEFNELPTHEQQEILDSTAEPVDNQHEISTSHELYALDRFFVEVQYLLPEKKIIYITASAYEDNFIRYTGDFQRTMEELFKL